MIDKSIVKESTKESTFFQNPPGLDADLTLRPTKYEDQSALRVIDLQLKERILAGCQ
jgi:hypothetical protein